MATRRHLRGIAFDLAKSFASRNNDAEGFWAVGQLYRWTVEHGAEGVSFSLVSDLHDPSAPLIQTVQCACSASFRWQLQKRGLKPNQVHSAHVYFRFDVPAERLTTYERYGRGTPFECCVEVVDDRGFAYSSVARGRVLPHDPNVELCSRRMTSNKTIEPTR